MEIKSEYLSQEQIKAILVDAQKAISQEIVNSAVNDVKYKIKWTLEQEVQADVTKWYKDNVQADVIAALATNKEVVVKTAVGFADEMAKQLSAGMSASIAEIMTSDWKRKKVFEALFG